VSQLQKYNGMDTIATFAIWHKLQEQFRPDTRAAYELLKALSAPSLYMMLRGILVDQDTVTKLHPQFLAECAQLEAYLDLITKSLGMGVINFASPVQVRWLFECLGATMPTKYVKGVAKASADRDTLEQVAKADPELAPVANIILAWRDRQKMLQVLAPELVDRDGRMRTTYKIAGTVTTRWSSSKNALWTGMNMQNIKRDEDEHSGHASIRTAFVADPGYKLFNIDLERADSWGVALEVFQATGDRKYFEACGSKDLHTYVSKLVWPKLAWTNDEAANIAIAKQYFYRQYDYRFMSKKGGHGSNYMGKGRTLAIQMKIPVHIAENFQLAYFREFKAIKLWHRIKAKELQTTGTLTNLFGIRRNFHSRLDADATVREAIAFLGQSVTAGSINRLLLRLWRCQLQMPDLGIELLGQVHDSIFGQFPADLEPEVLDLIRYVAPVHITVTSPSNDTIQQAIPIEIATGWNLASWSPTNIDGLKKAARGKHDERQRHHVPRTTKLGFMDKRLSGLHRRPQQPTDVSEVGSDCNDRCLS
jgi:DNA polymerase I-like protein with 3'-5' exonuclease and polymerase domains